MSIKSTREWLVWHSVRSHVLTPIWLRISQKHRWAVVNLLNRSQRQCWSELVSEALAVPESDPCDVRIPSMRAERPLCASICEWGHPDHVGEHACSCYCGKFQFAATKGARDHAPNAA